MMLVIQSSNSTWLPVFFLPIFPTTSSACWASVRRSGVGSSASPLWPQFCFSPCCSPSRAALAGSFHRAAPMKRSRFSVKSAKKISKPSCSEW